MKVLSIVFVLLLLPAAARAQNTPRVDLMVVAAHPDDEGIFGGGVLPYYARVQGLKVVQLTMTLGQLPHREPELQRAIDVYAGATGSGVRPYTAGNITLVAGNLPDVFTTDVAATWDAWKGRDNVAQVVALEIRRYRPRVVVSVHSLVGDYGHGNHMATAVAVIDGAARAADPSSSVTSPTNEAFAAWQVDAVYLRGTLDENQGTTVPDLLRNALLQPFFHDYWERRLIAGSSARQIANLGLKQHWSQYYLLPRVASVYCEALAGTKPDGKSDFEYIKSHPSETWTLISTKSGARLPPSTFVIDGTEYRDWARGDFFGVTTAALPPPSGLKIDGFGTRSVTASPPAATDVSVVNFREGSLEQVGCRRWAQFATGSPTPVRLLTEEYALAITLDKPELDLPTGPSAYVHGRRLVLKDGDNYRLLIDLDAMEVRESQERLPLGDDAGQIAVRSGTAPTYATKYTNVTVDKRVNGRMVSEVVTETGQAFRLERPGATVWHEYVDGAKAFSFEATRRDQWSVWLVDNARGVTLQLDLHRGAVLYFDRKDPNPRAIYAIKYCR